MTTGTDLARARVQEFGTKLDRASDLFRASLPAHVTWDKFRRAALVAVQTTPKILEASTQSVMLALSRCAADGLMPDGIEAVLLPYKRKSGVTTASYLPMVSGLRKLAYQTGMITMLRAECVYADDEFSIYTDGDGPHFIHRPNLDGERRDDQIRGAYAVAKMRSGQTFFRYLSRAEINKAKATSTSGCYEDSPWQRWYARMCEKTALKRLSRELPRSTDRDDLIFYRAADRDADVDELPRPAIPSPAHLTSDAYLSLPQPDDDDATVEPPADAPPAQADAPPAQPQPDLTPAAVTFRGQSWSRSSRGAQEWANAIGKAAAECSAAGDTAGARAVFAEYGPQLEDVLSKLPPTATTAIAAIGAVLAYGEDIGSE